MAWNARKPMGGTGLPAEVMQHPERQRLLWLLGRVSIDGLAPPRVF
jgi:hypothetical protein